MLQKKFKKKNLKKKIIKKKLKKIFNFYFWNIKNPVWVVEFLIFNDHVAFILG